MNLSKKQIIKLKFKLQLYCYEECPVASKRDKFYMDCECKECGFYPLSPWANKPKPPHPDQIPLPNKTIEVKPVRKLNPDLELIIYPEKEKDEKIDRGNIQKIDGFLWSPGSLSRDKSF